MRLIHLPLLRPAMLGAVIVVFVDCLKELPATLLLRPLNVETLATSIYQFASRGSFEDGALAAIDEITALLKQHFPPRADNPNELPDKPVLL